MALPEATKKCGQGLALVPTNSEGVTDGSGSQDHPGIAANPPDALQHGGLVLLCSEFGTLLQS